MNKISGILPTSARIEAVDLRNERPLRSGVVSFGQPVAKATERISPVQKETIDNISSDDVSRELKIPGRKTDEKIVEEISSSFFAKNIERDANPKLMGVEGDSVYQPESSSKRLSVYA